MSHARVRRMNLVPASIWRHAGPGVSASVLVACLFPIDAAAATLHVVGTTTFDARVVPLGAGLELRGNLRDDAGRGVSGTVKVTLPAAATAVACSGSGLGGDAATGWKVSSDSSGGFCVRVRGAVSSAHARLEYAGDPDRSGCGLDVPLDPGRASVAIVLDPEPSVFRLDRPKQSVWARVKAEPAEAAADPIQLVLALEDGDRTVSLATATARAGDRIELSFASKDLGAPGPATLRLSFAGSVALQAAKATASVLRATPVRLELARQPDRRDPSQGLLLDVGISWQQGPVSSGFLEASLGRESLGVARVENGGARLEPTFEVAREGDVAVTIAYLPSAPWWLPGDPLVVSVPVRPASPWRRVPWFLAAAVIVAWVGWAWRRPGPAPTRRGPEHEPTGRPSLEPVIVGPPRSGWRGKVVDAHDGTAIADAMIAIVVPTFGAGGSAAATRTNDRGEFELPHAPEGLTEGARMEVAATHHSRLARPVPPAGTIIVQLVSRRRALLGRLVAWAAKRGRPWYPRSDPTPAHVAGVAERTGESAVAPWARAIEQAAFGPVAPDEGREREIAGAEPKAAVVAEPPASR